MLLFPAAQRARADAPPRVTDETVAVAIERARDWLMLQRSKAGDWESSRTDTGDRFWGGGTALATLALLNAGENPRSDEMQQTLTWLAAQPLRATYVYSLRAQALSLVPGGAFERRLQDDLDWLVAAAHVGPGPHAGGYWYESASEKPQIREFDHSNSQFGVLGVWMATEAGMAQRAPNEFWERVKAHWLAQQNSDGGWGYQPGRASTGSMSAAGLSTLYIVLDRLHGRSGHRDALDLIAALRRGENWLGREFTTKNPYGDSGWVYYYLYGLERAGRASGRKYFRERDWFRAGAADLLASQTPDGSWPGGLHNTCFATLFLCHGRAPLLLNEYEPIVGSDPYLRDAAGLNRFAQHALERLLNWQILGPASTIEDLLEAPILYLSGDAGLELPEPQRALLREYALRGGMIVGVCVGGSQAFADSFRALGSELFAAQRWTALRGEHPLLATQFRIDSAPAAQELHNGVRTLMLLVQDDVAQSWNEYRVRRGQRDFEFGCNLYAYATDKVAVRSRLTTPTIALEPTATRRTIRLAQVQYQGRWNPEPWSWSRLRTYMNNTTGTTLLIEPGVRLDAPELQQFDVAWMSGDAEFALSAAERDGLRRFLVAGGTLLTDATNGSMEFRGALEQAVTDALRVASAPVPADSALISAEGLDDGVALTSVSYRRALRAMGRRGAPPLRGFALGPRYAVLHSPVDIGASLLGTPIYDLRGYDASSALRVARNMLLYAALPAEAKARIGVK